MKYLKIYIFIVFIFAAACFLPIKTSAKVVPPDFDGKIHSAPFGIPKPTKNSYQQPVDVKIQHNDTTEEQKKQPLINSKISDNKNVYLNLFSVVNLFWLALIIILILILILSRPRKS